MSSHVVEFHFRDGWRPAIALRDHLAGRTTLWFVERPPINLDLGELEKWLFVRDGQPADKVMVTFTTTGRWLCTCCGATPPIYGECRFIRVAKGIYSLAKPLASVRQAKERTAS